MCVGGSGKEGASLVGLGPYLVSLSQAAGVRIVLNCRTPGWCGGGAWSVGKLHLWGPQWSGVRAEVTQGGVLLYIHSVGKIHSLKTKTQHVKLHKQKTSKGELGEFWCDEKITVLGDHIGSRHHCYVTLASHLASLGICDVIFDIKKERSFVKCLPSFKTLILQIEVRFTIPRAQDNFQALRVCPRLGFLLITVLRRILSIDGAWQSVKWLTVE